MVGVAVEVVLVLEVRLHLDGAERRLGPGILQQERALEHDLDEAELVLVDERLDDVEHGLAEPGGVYRYGSGKHQREGSGYRGH